MNLIKDGILTIPMREVFEDTKKRTVVQVRHELRLMLMWELPVYNMKSILIGLIR